MSKDLNSHLIIVEPCGPPASKVEAGGGTMPILFGNVEGNRLIGNLWSSSSPTITSRLTLATEAEGSCRKLLEAFPIPPNFVCELCREGFREQFSFYLHLKDHYDGDMAGSYGSTSDARGSNSVKVEEPPQDADLMTISGSSKLTDRDRCEPQPCKTATDSANLALTDGGCDLKLSSNQSNTNSLDCSANLMQLSKSGKEPNVTETFASSSTHGYSNNPKAVASSSHSSVECPQITVDRKLSTVESEKPTPNLNLEKEFQDIMKLTRSSTVKKKKHAGKSKVASKTKTETNDNSTVRLLVETPGQLVFEEVEVKFEDVQCILPDLGHDDFDDEEETQFMYRQSNICPSCDHQCDSSEQLDSHMLKHHPDIFTLEEASSKVKKHRALRDRHSEVPKRSGLTCHFCSRVFQHRNSLVYHIRGHTGDRPYKCNICDKRFFATSALTVHMRMHAGLKPYKCDECEKTFRQWGDLSYHKTSLHSNERAFQCEFCGKNFARKYSLTVHRRIHTDERNYKCDICNKGFRASSYLQNHRRVHTGEKPHPCSICRKTFRVRSDMKRHEESHGRAVKKLLNAAGITKVTTVPTTKSATVVPVISSVGESLLQGNVDKPLESLPTLADGACAILDKSDVSGNQGTSIPKKGNDEICIPIPIISPHNSSLVTSSSVFPTGVSIALVDGLQSNSSISNPLGHLHPSAVVTEAMTLYQDTSTQNLELLSSDGSTSGTVVLVPFMQG